MTVWLHRYRVSGNVDPHILVDLTNKGRAVHTAMRITTTSTTGSSPHIRNSEVLFGIINNFIGTSTTRTVTIISTSRSIHLRFNRILSTDTHNFIGETSRIKRPLKFSGVVFVVKAVAIVFVELILCIHPNIFIIRINNCVWPRLSDLAQHIRPAAVS